MAQQHEPVKRLVAIKLVKSGMDRRSGLARFEAERQALALMDHPNIAKVFDAGATPDGRPFFVMELVKGVRITHYCDERRLTPRERLELFVPVCQAIQHAHQKGVIHRDLKPSNVLVALYDDRPVPKVIDFGVAKAAGQQLTEKTLHTGFGAVVGTVEYMSPEQAGFNQLDVDTRSDIYSLGVLLYELLTGTPPLSRKDLEKAGMLEMLRLIREQEPSKPSTKLSTAEGLPTIAANRGTEPAKLTRLVRGELDWIVMKALEKDRNRRYETANGIAMDVQRYLADEQVLACPPSVGYRLRKFVRRNKAALGMASVIGVAILLAVGSLGWVVRDREAGRVRTAAEVNQFLERAEALYDENKLPEAVAEIEKARGVLEAGRGDEKLGRRVRQWRTDLDTAARLEEIPLEWYDHEDRDRVYADYAQVFREYGIDVEALPDAEVTARVATSQIRLNLVRALVGWAWRLRSDSRPEAFARQQRLTAIARAAEPDPLYLRLQAADEAKDVRTLREMADGADPVRTRARTLAYLGDSLRVAGDQEAAVAFLRKAQRRHPGDFTLNSVLAQCLIQTKSPPWDEVIAFRRAALAVRPQSALAHYVLGYALLRADRLDEAVVEYREAIRLRPGYAYAHNGLGLALKRQGKLPEAIAAAEKAIKIDPTFANAYVTLGDALYDQGKLPEATAAYEKAVKIDPNSASVHQWLGFALKRQGKLPEAIAAYEKAIALDPKAPKVYVNLGNALFDLKKPDEAITAFRNAIENDPKYLLAYNNLGNVLTRQGKLPEAIAAYHKAIALDPQSASAHHGLGFTLWRQGKLPEAIAEYEKAIALDPKAADAHYNFGLALNGQGKLPEAIAEYEKAIALDPKAADVYLDLGNALLDLRKPDEAIAAYQKAIEIDPKFADAHYNLGFALQSPGKLEEAIAEYRQAIRLKPDDSEVRRGLDDALARKTALDAALAQGAVREQRRLLWPGAHVLSIAFMPDGKRALAASDVSAGPLELYDLANGRVIRRFDGHTSWIPQVSLSSDGRRALTASNDKTVRLWDVDAGKCLHKLEGHTAEVYSAALSPDGRRAASASADRTVRLWDLETGRELCQCPVNATCVAFSPDGKQLVIAGAGGPVSLCDAASLKELRTFAGNKGGTWCATFTPDGRRILSAGNDKMVRLWDVESGNELRRFEGGHTRAVHWVALSADGRRAVSTSHAEQQVILWDVETGKVLRRFVADRSVRKAVLGPDDRLMACGSFRGVLYLFDVTDAVAPK
jgi:tetratricopeptide (TPR) repeat protein